MVIHGWCCVALLMLISDPAHAYIDPGAGSLALQLLLAGLFAAMMYFKQLWWRVKAFFSGLRAKVHKTDD